MPHKHYATLAYLDIDNNEVDAYCECGVYLGTLEPIQIEARDKVSGFIYAHSRTTIMDTISQKEAREIERPFPRDS